MSRGFDVVIIDEAAQAVRIPFKRCFIMEHLRLGLYFINFWTITSLFFRWNLQLLYPWSMGADKFFLYAVHFHICFYTFFLFLSISPPLCNLYIIDTTPYYMIEVRRHTWYFEYIYSLLGIVVHIETLVCLSLCPHHAFISWSACVQSHHLAQFLSLQKCSLSISAHECIDYSFC